MKKIAAIDIGSNAVRMLICYVISSGKEYIFQKNTYLRLPLRLGEDSFSNGIISEGKIKTHYLIIATNGYSEKDIGNEHYNIIGVPSYIAATNILGQEKVQKLLPKLRMYSDSKNDLYYFRPSPDHKRILFGAFPVWAYGMENSKNGEVFFL